MFVKKKYRYDVMICNATLTPFSPASADLDMIIFVSIVRLRTTNNVDARGFQ